LSVNYALDFSVVSEASAKSPVRKVGLFISSRCRLRQQRQQRRQRLHERARSR
jgi:hypothetical protein